MNLTFAKVSLLSLSLSLLGCGSIADTNALVGNSNSTSSVVVDMVSPRSLQGVSLKYFVSLLDSDGYPLIDEVSITSAASSAQTLLSQVPPGPARLLVRVETSDGEVIATQEQEINVVPGQSAQLQVGSYFFPGQTSQIGLVSLGANGTRPDGTSVSPTISTTGRFVAFASSSNLVAGGPQDRQQILLRDRTLGTLSRVSLNTNNNAVSIDCFEPDIDGSGNQVVFRAGNVNQQGSIFVRLRNQARTVFLQPGRKPRISANGSFVVLEFIDVNSGRQSVVLHSVRGSTVEVISRNSAGAVSNGDASKPCISGDGRFVVFASQATDIIPGGTPGIYLLDRNTSVFERLPIAANLEDTSITPDGKFILASTPGQVPTLFNRELGALIPLSSIQGLVGRPSMSRDANFITFFSSSPNLIDNDLNGKTDCFVFNRTLGTIDRINISQDGTAVAGGVDEETPLTGPVISSDGKRVAFSSRDARLVPDNSNPLLDIYSAAVPSAGLLYVANSDTIFRFAAASTANGPQQPVLDGFSGSLRGISSIFLDTANDRLYVVNGAAANFDPGIAVFNQASRLSGNNLVPSREITGPGLKNLNHLIVDTSRDILYASAGNEVIAIPNASTVNGEVPLSGQRRFKFASFGHEQLLLDARRDELYVASNDPNTLGRFVGVVKASTASGAPPIVRALFGPNSQLDLNFLTDLTFDTSPGATTNRSSNDSRLVVGLRVGNQDQLSTFNSNGSFSGFLSNVPPNSITPVTSVSTLIFDPFTNLRYVGGRDAAMRVYRSTSVTDSPSRSLTFNFTPNPVFFPHYALDRTR